MGDDGGVCVVFCTGTNQRDPTNINFFDDVLLRSTGSNGFGKWVQIHHHQVKQRDFILSDFLHVLGQFSASQDATKHFWVKGFHSAAKNGRVSGDVFHSYTRDVHVFDELARSSGRVKGYIFFV